MQAMLLTCLALLDDNPEPLTLASITRPTPAADEILIRVHVCGVCHTELDEIEGRTPPPQLPVVPGHEVVGSVVERGAAARRFELDDRVGVGWIFNSSGTTEENLSAEFVATGRDVNGGYAEYMVAKERYAYAIPENFSDAEAAPLLCAGGVGYRALMQAGISNGEVLGLTGFGGSGHLVLQLARYLYPESPVYVFARSPSEQAFARELGAAWSGGTGDSAPSKAHAIIDTTPAWRPVLAGLLQLRPGGRLVINAIRKEATDRHLMADIDYGRHLWQEKTLTTVANVTGSDIENFLEAAASAGLTPEVETYPLEAANQALRELRDSHVRGAKVLIVDQAIRRSRSQG